MIKDELYLKMTERFMYKNHMLDFILPVTKEIFKFQEINILVLFNKYFPSYVLRQYDLECKWEDYILENEKIKFDWGINHVYFNVPFYYNIGDSFYVTNISENGASITFDLDHDDQQVCILVFRPNVFTNKNFIDKYDEGKGWSKIWVDQTISATLNRKILSDFLKELEIILDTEIIEISSGYIDQKYLYRYGVKDAAVLDYPDAE